MTELPPELSANVGGGASQQSVRAFSQRGKTGRGDTSAWTDTPEERKAKEAQALLQAASAQYVMMLPAAGPAGPGGSAVGGATAAAMDTYNNAARKKSLMEVHLEAQVGHLGAGAGKLGRACWLASLALLCGGLGRRASYRKRLWIVVLSPARSGARCQLC